MIMNLKRTLYCNTSPLALHSTPCDLVRKVSYDLRVLLNNRETSKGHFDNKLELRGRSCPPSNPYPAQMVRSEVLGRKTLTKGSHDKKMEMILAKVKLEELKL